MIDNLMNLGLTKNEAVIFRTLLEEGPSFVAPLVYKTKKHRQIIYNALDKLQKRQLVSVSQKNGKNFYAIGDPKQLLIGLQQKEIVARNVVEEISKQLKTEKERVEVFSGPESYKRGLASFRMHAAESGEYIVIGGEPREWYLYTKPFFKNHVGEVKKLKKQGVDICILFFEQEKESAEEFIKPYLNNPYQCKIANNVAGIPHTAWLAGNNVYILTPAADPLVIHIRSNALAEEYRKYFSNQWAMARSI